MSSVYLAIPLPPFHRWLLLPAAEDCPDGHVVIARLGSGRRLTVSDQVALAPASSLEAAMPASLEELIRLFARLSAERRARLLAVARELEAA